MTNGMSHSYVCSWSSSCSCSSSVSSGFSPFSLSASSLWSSMCSFSASFSLGFSPSPSSPFICQHHHLFWSHCLVFCYHILFFSCFLQFGMVPKPLHICNRRNCKLCTSRGHINMSWQNYRNIMMLYNLQHIQIW